MRVGLVVVVGSLTFALASSASAQTNDGAARAAARKLGYEGVAAYEAEHYDVATQKLEKAFAVLQAPSLGLWSARALVKQDKLLEAVERYLTTSRLSLSGGDLVVQKRAKADAVTEADATQALIPSLVIRVDGAQPGDVTLRVDGFAVSSQLIGDAMPVNPGAHRVEASRGAETVRSEVSVQRKDQVEVLLRFQRMPGQAVAGAPSGSPATPIDGPPRETQPSNAHRTLAWTALGVGGVGLAVGAIAGGFAAAKRSMLDKDVACAETHRCPRILESDVSSYNSLRTVSTVGFVVGGVLGVTGVVLLLTQPHGRTETSASLWISPRGVALTGQFQ